MGFLKFNVNPDQASVMMAHAFGNEIAADTGVFYSEGTLYVPESLAHRFDGCSTTVLPAAMRRQIIQAEASRRILASYPIWKQLNAIRAGGQILAEMSAYIDGVRDASNDLELHSDADHADDRHWPPSP